MPKPEMLHLILSYFREDHEAHEYVKNQKIYIIEYIHNNGMSMMS